MEDFLLVVTLPGVSPSEISACAFEDHVVRLSYSSKLLGIPDQGLNLELPQGVGADTLKLELTLGCVVITGSYNRGKCFFRKLDVISTEPNTNQPLVPLL